MVSSSLSLSFINDSLLAETPCFVLYYALTSIKRKARWTGPLISSPAFVLLLELGGKQNENDRRVRKPRYQIPIYKTQYRLYGRG